LGLAVVVLIPLQWVPAVALQAGDSAVPVTLDRAAPADGRRLQLAAGGAPDKLLMPPPRSPRRGLLVPPALVRVKPALPTHVSKALGLETKPLPAPRESVMAAPLEPSPSETVKDIPDLPETSDRPAWSPLAAPVQPAMTGEPTTTAEAMATPMAVSAPEPTTAPEVVGVAEPTTTPEAASAPETESALETESTPEAASAPPSPSTPQASAPPPEPDDSAAETTAADSTGAPATQTAALPPLEGVRLLFAEDTADLSDAVKRDLVRFAEDLLRHDKQRIQLLAYAQGTEDSASRARRLSLSRALAVRNYLMEQGVLPTRMDVRALGNKTDDDPRDRVDVEPARR
jgi:outer membrane protein OmpA-like peptidoglycan-associated protein